jgi:peptidoglycan-N-acetylglucosamine deacetylase
VYFVKTPRFVQKLFPKAVWFIPSDEKKIFLTFDDGPTPEITDWVLGELKKHNAKATFFVLGKNVKRYPELFTNIINNAHAVGNHSFNHLNGWNTDDEKYFDDIEKAEQEIQIRNHKSEIINPKSLFRPPYGRITLSQYSLLTTRNKLVMWDVLSGDFDHKLSGEKCADNCIRNTQPGSILVFHDSHKAFERLKICLPLVLKHFSDEGFTFAAIE